MTPQDSPPPLDVLPFDDEGLLLAYDKARHEANLAAINKGHWEQEIFRRLEERGARAIASNLYICELEPQNIYVQASFMPLKEVLQQRDLETVLTPAHHETVNVPDKWNTVKLVALARRYPEVQALVDQARIEARGRLKFERRDN